MALSLYDASIPTYINVLGNLGAILRKAEAHAKAGGIEPETYLEARIAPDMHPLLRQIQMASDIAKNGAARLADLAAPVMPDVETTWVELKDRIAKTIAFLESVDRAAIDAGDDERIIELRMPNGTLPMTARDYLLRFSFPNLYFHVVMAYALLRGQGVPVGKLDYLRGDQPLPA